MNEEFKPGCLAAKEKLKLINISNYSRTRNYLNGQVTRLSPYITHGLLDLTEIYSLISTNTDINFNEKFIKELAWREYFYHVWHHKKDKIFSSLKEGVIAEHYYSKHLPEDIRQGQTGLKPIDKSIEILYKSGYLHNHARLWLASYLIHYRKIHWRVGADWMYSHLLDGDLASNHLSWQWVAGTNSHKPYIFNAENVSKFAPTSWSCYGSEIDLNYAELEEIAFSNKILASRKKENIDGFFSEPDLFNLPICNFSEIQDFNFKDVLVIHPWSIKNTTEKKKFKKIVGVFFLEFHKKWPWNKNRWEFVISGMKEICDEIFICSNVNNLENSNIFFNMHLDQIDGFNKEKFNIIKIENIWSSPDFLCSSFSKFWKKTNKKI